MELDYFHILHSALQAATLHQSKPTIAKRLSISIMVKPILQVHFLLPSLVKLLLKLRHLTIDFISEFAQSSAFVDPQIVQISDLEKNIDPILHCFTKLKLSQNWYSARFNLLTLASKSTTSSQYL